MEVSTRIKQIIKEKNLSIRSFSRSIGFADTTIGNVISGKSDPGYKLLNAICSVYADISPEWLVAGIGDMYRHNNPQNTPGGGTVPIEVYMEAQKQVTELIAMLKSCQDQLGKMIGISKDLVTKGNGAPQDNDVGCADAG